MATASQPASLLRFDVFELDTRALELRKRGVRQRLQGQPLLVLAVLLEGAGELVTREELRAQIWPADTFVDFDHSLHNAIARLREALGDSAEKPRYVETLPRRGYRFIAPVEKVGVTAPELSVTEQRTEPLKPVMPSKPHGVLVFALLSLMVIGLALWLVPAASHRTSASPSIRSIAVLPLENLSGDPSQDYFANGMTDELITDLAKVGALRVTSRTTITRYKNTKKSLPEIARELNVEGIVEGSVMRSGNRVRVTAQLIHASTDQHLWAETYERDLGDVLRLQSEVAESIAQHVRAELTPEQQARFRSTRTVNPEAYEAYVRGRYYLSNQFTMAEPLNKAKSYFEEAIRKEPDFALAYSGLADSHLYLGFFAQGQISAKDVAKSAHEALRKALELDDSIGEIHDTLAVLSWRFDWDFDTTDREFNKAIALAPSYSCAHEDRANFLGFIGRRDEALAEVAKSNEIDPGPGSAMTEAGVYYQLRDWAHLVEASRRGVIAYPNEWLEHFNLAVGYEATGKRLEAIAEYQKALEMSDGNQDATAALAYAYAAAGQRAEAGRILRDLEQKSKTAYISPYLLGTVYAGLGDNDKAFELLEKAHREKSLELSWHIKADQRIDSLRADPRFENLLTRVGRKY